MTRVPCWIVDAFTAEPFRGNPAAVCWLERPREADWMQSVAAEMNLSETAFIEPQGEAFGLRWFTPTVEVPLCGHATLASAHVLYASGRLDTDRAAHFDTRSGRLMARADGELIVLDFPAYGSVAATPPPALVDAVGVHPIEVRRVDREGTDSVWIFRLEDEAAVRAAAPRFGAMKAVAPDPVILTAAPTSPGFDFVSRYFAPGHGLDEDPVTGSAHCMLAPFWRTHLGREAFLALQVSARTGVLRVTLRAASQAGERVELAGQSVTIAEGTLAV